MNFTVWTNDLILFAMWQKLLSLGKKKNDRYMTEEEDFMIFYQYSQYFWTWL